MRRSLLATSAVFALTLGSPALALAPADVWASWSPWLEDQGFTTESAGEEDGVFVVRGLSKSDADGDTLVPIMRLMPEGDTVVVSWPEAITHSKESDGVLTLDATKMELRLDDASSPGVLGMVAGALTGDVGMELSVPGQDGEDAVMSAFIGGVAIDAPQGDSQDGAMVSTVFQSMDFAFEMPAPEGGTMSLTGENGPFEGRFEVSGLAALTAGDPIAAISQGTNLRMSGKHGAGTYTMVHPTEGSTQSWSDGAFGASLDRDGIAYNAEMNGVAMGGALPDGMGTFTATATQMAFGALFPLFAQGQNQPARFDLTIADLIVDAESVAIPAEMKAIFAEPMGIVLGVSAQVEMFQDLFPTSMDSEPESPETAGRVVSVDLETFDVSFAGSTATATGEAAVTGTTFADSQPGPAKGTLSLGNIAAAMDVLQDAGLLDGQTRGMAEGMLRGFAKPGEVDPLTYELETDDWVGFSVNGNRL